MEQIKQVYDMLEDEISKDIYINKANYLVTGKSCYLEHIIDTCVPELKRSKCSLAQDIRKGFPGLDVVIWGCGYLVRNNIECCKEIERLVGFCDHDRKKQKEGFLGFPVIAPEELFLNHKDAVIVIGTGNYYEEVKTELCKRGVPHEHIINFGNYVSMSSARQYFEELFLEYGTEEIFVDAGAFDLFSTMRLRGICGERLKKRMRLNRIKSIMKDAGRLWKKETFLISSCCPMAHGIRKRHCNLAKRAALCQVLVKTEALLSKQEP